jgi:Icc-related predicted phosphoesterase
MLAGADRRHRLLPGSWGRSVKRKRAQRWFFATDVHGSDRCYRKFLAAAKVYEADVLLLGGDVAGKGIVPLVEREDGRYDVVFQGAEETTDARQLDAMTDRIAFNGLYPYRCSRAELKRLHDETHRDELFRLLIAEQLRRWIKATEERLDDTIRCIITPGNDDPTVVDEVLVEADRVECPERQLVQVGPVGLASLGNTNATPWHTDREYAEDELRAQIDDMLVNARDFHALMFNFHCPPFNTGLDLAPELDDAFRPVVRNGAMRTIPVGSSAVLEAIEKYAPSVGVHGHIHESQGAVKVGSTRCYNPGSDYSSGVLKGLILDLDARGQYVDYLFTSG